MAKKPKEKIASVSDWSDIIRQQGENRIKREEERIEQMEFLFPSTVKRLPNKSVDDLLNLYCQSQAYYIHPKERDIWNKFGIAIKAEINRRIDKKECVSNSSSRNLKGE